MRLKKIKWLKWLLFNSTSDQNKHFKNRNHQSWKYMHQNEHKIQKLKWTKTQCTQMK